MSRLTINDFINSGPGNTAPNTRENSSAAEQSPGLGLFRGISTAGSKARISSKIFSAARNFRMN